MGQHEGAGVRVFLVLAKDKTFTDCTGRTEHFCIRNSYVAVILYLLLYLTRIYATILVRRHVKLCIFVILSL